MYKIHKLVFNYFQESSMVLAGEGGRCVLIDPGFYTEDEQTDYFEMIESKGLKPEAILLTHGHPDHIWGVGDTLRHFGEMPVYVSEADEITITHMFALIKKLGMKQPDTSFRRTYVKEGQTVRAAGFGFKVIETPGHTPGGVCYLEEKEAIMFTGDTLFAGTIGTSSLEFGDYDKEIVSIMDKLMVLDGGITIYPGHGPSSTIGYERMNNPFLEPFNEKDTFQSQNGDPD